MCDCIAPHLIRRIVHGSGGNVSKDKWRRAYVIAFR